MRIHTLSKIFLPRRAHIIQRSLQQLKFQTNMLKSQQYQEIRQLGKGSFGYALLVNNVRNNGTYVMKIINISQMKKSEREEAQREAEVMSKFDHPNIIKYYDAFIENNQLFIVMEYANAGDLQQLISQQKKIGKFFLEDQVLFYFVQILLAMKHVHSKRTIHRDIKAPNIFLKKVTTMDNKIRLQVKVGDFGVAKVLTSTIECAKTVIGTPYYLSPEICNNRGYNSKSDVWALGCILYELCTLQHVFDAQNLKLLVVKILEGNYKPINSKQYSKNLCNLVSEMLQKDPDKRPTINQILEKDFIKVWIPKLLPQDVIQREFVIQSNQSSQQSYEEFGDDVQQGGTNQAIAQFQQQLQQLKGKQSNMYRLEKFRGFLEQNLGLDKFCDVYTRIQEQLQSKGQKGELNFQQIHNLLGSENSGYLNLIMQMIYLEQSIQ